MGYALEYVSKIITFSVSISGLNFKKFDDFWSIGNGGREMQITNTL